MTFGFSVLAAVVMLSGSVSAADSTAEMHRATPDGPSDLVGTVMISAGEHGAVFAINLAGIEPLSEHGFHIHAGGSCEAKEKAGKMVPALAAGGHWDPKNTGKHEGWQGQGHLGDLPLLHADAGGQINSVVTVSRITDVAQLKGHALMLHAGGDNYSDIPKKLGGGGARMLCGVIE